MHFTVLWQTLKRFRMYIIYYVASFLKSFSQCKAAKLKVVETENEMSEFTVMQIRIFSPGHEGELHLHSTYLVSIPSAFSPIMRPYFSAASRSSAEMSV